MEGHEQDVKCVCVGGGVRGDCSDIGPKNLLTGVKKRTIWYNRLSTFSFHLYVRLIF